MSEQRYSVPIMITLGCASSTLLDCFERSEMPIERKQEWIGRALLAVIHNPPGSDAYAIGVKHLKNFGFEFVKASVVDKRDLR